MTSPDITTVIVTVLTVLTSSAAWKFWERRAEKRERDKYDIGIVRNNKDHEEIEKTLQTIEEPLVSYDKTEDGNYDQEQKVTLYPYILKRNEEYDDEIDDIKRFDLITKEIERLNKFTDDEWIEFTKNVKPIVDYNYDLIMSKTDYAITKNITTKW